MNEFSIDVAANRAWFPQSLITPECNTALQWYGSDSKEEFDRNNNNHYSYSDINYHFNEYGYRSDSFNEVADLRMMFLGCSITHGAGVKYEEVWSYRVVQNIRNRFNIKIPHWNFGREGASVDKIARLLYLAIPIIKPDIVVCLLPDVFRIEMAAYKDKLVSVGPWMGRKSHLTFKPTYEEIMTVHNEHQGFYNYVKNLIFMDSMCKNNNASFLWSSWQRRGLENCNDIPTDLKSKFVEGWDVWHKMWEKPFARDKKHPGLVAHNDFATSILPTIIPLIQEKLNVR